MILTVKLNSLTHVIVFVSDEFFIEHFLSMVVFSKVPLVSYKRTSYHSHLHYNRVVQRKLVKLRSVTFNI